MKTTEERDLVYFQGFDVGVTYVLTAIILHFENGKELVELIKGFIDPELDQMKGTKQ
jgi:hypothetical protein